tara:strand:+ start:514 stop:1026 length:513 start_codon:yes stop_codon:yes gene_type:complete
MKHTAHILLIGLAPLAIVSHSGAVAAQEAPWSGAYFGGDVGLTLGNSNDVTRSLHFGVNRQMGRTVLGGEVEYIETDIGTRVGTIDDMTLVKLRAGRVKGKTLYYGVLGGGQAHGRFGSEIGYVAGFGAEYAISSDLTVGGEMMHQGFSDFAGSGSLGVNTLSARVSYHF